MKDISLNWDMARQFIEEQELYRYREPLAQAHKQLHDKTGAGNEYLGWLDLPNVYDKEECMRIKQTANSIEEHSDALVVIGIGGSYLGARAVIEALQHSFYNLLDRKQRKFPQIFFVGQHISSTYVTELLEVLQDKDVTVNVISKSGTTTEPAIAFRIFENWMEQRYSREEMKRRIIVTTDEHKGALKQLAEERGYQTYVIPDDIGGRYSVLTAVGLLPIAVAGIDIEQLLEGAKRASEIYAIADINRNDAYMYAALRNILYDNGKRIEVLAYSEPGLQYIAEWWKQLFGESEGKQGKGIFPAAVGYTTDLHSLGQYIQDGQRNLFETVVALEKGRHDIFISKHGDNRDGLDYLAGKSMDYINHKALEGTIAAHRDGNVPCLQIMIPEPTAYCIGQLLYFFEKSCAVSGYLLQVNPFDQPGVEHYKANMFALLGKEGY